MNKFLRRLFSRCQHHWEVFETLDVFRYNRVTGKRSEQIGQEYVLRCKHCGDMKTKRV
jgi:hypothetical protein